MNAPNTELEWHEAQQWAAAAHAQMVAEYREARAAESLKAYRAAIQAVADQMPAIAAAFARLGQAVQQYGLEIATYFRRWQQPLSLPKMTARQYRTGRRQRAARERKARASTRRSAGPHHPERI